ncbi:hypothetical protein H0H81_009797 [Sphagnurus paluster]|uniref:Uncharacterized protein n=1 Tax=Sphagnurus paluster TaxID=117069 RepID=A0A9P7FXC9_9AGAR|nr:hypothetical protein H0H81_009797 [Sphagnurus paluster]
MSENELTAVYSITFQNLSLVDLTRTKTFYPTLKDGPIIDNNIPSNNEIKAGGGVETLAWNEYIDFLAVGDSATGVVYKNPKTGASFGIQIETYIQVFGIGSAPKWSVSYHGQNDWKKVVEDPAMAWDMPDESAKASGFDVRVEPVAGHQSLKLLVIISEYRAGFDRKDLVKIE